MRSTPCTTHSSFTKIPREMTGRSREGLVVGKRDIKSKRSQSVSRHDPSLENESLLTGPQSLNVCRGAPEAASQSRTDLSPEADASSLPSGEKATAQTEFE